MRDQESIRPIPLLGGLDIVTFANDWTADPTSKHHVMRRFARTNDVLWVETAGMRTPRLSSAYDRKRLLTKAVSMTRSARWVADGVHVYSPPALPYPHSRSAQRINAISYELTTRMVLRRLGMDRRPLMCVFAPQCAPWIRRIPREYLIYYCVDRWSAFKGFDARTMELGEEELCRRANVVLASAEDLAERCARFSRNVHYVPHGVDYEHFVRALEPGPLPADLAAIPEPRVGFFGLIHEWVDLDLIGRLADMLPYSFVLIGATSEDLSGLLARQNVHYLGRRAFASLPDYSRGFDAALVPFRLTELTASVNPIKLREYAAAGLPIVSSDLPEVRKCPTIARIARTRDEWIDAVREAVERGRDVEERRRQSRRVEREDWAYVTNAISTLVNARSLSGDDLGG